MRVGVIFRYMGMISLLNSAFMLLAAGISYFNGIDSGFAPLTLSAILAAALGAFPLIFVKKTANITSKEGYCIVTGAWLLACVVGTFPYLLWGGEFSILNAWFESVSGFTTTGATILNDIEALPKGLLFWRSATHWLGGMGVVMFALAVLPAMGKTHMTLSSMELSSMAMDNFRYRTKKIVRILLFVYIGMTLLETLLLRIAGMGWFDAVNHSFSTVATGGFSTRNLSIAAFDNIWIEIIITCFTFASGLHFGLIFATLAGNRNNVFRNEVSRYYFLCMLIGAILISANIWESGVYDTFGSSLRHGVFQSVSIMTTTGFATADTNAWTPFAMAVLLFFSIQCGCAGSTSGGLKSDRVLLAFKVIKTRIRQQQHPNAIFRIKLNGVMQEDVNINFAMLFIVVYILFIIMGTLVNTAAGTDFMTGFSASISCLGNVGPGFGEIGSLDNYGALPGISKLMSTALMLFGRLEIFGLIQLFTMKWWV